MISRNLKWTLLPLVSIYFSSLGWGWGTKGHETIETVAAQLLPKSGFAQLIKNNIKAVDFLSMAPDLAWKHGAEYNPIEGQAHFFQVDFYSPRGGEFKANINFYIQRNGASAVFKKGTAPWRVQQMANLLISMLRTRNAHPKEILQIASALGHYVGDIGNPLHVATDFDGAGVGHKGLHSFFETESLNAIDDKELLIGVTRAATSLLHSIPNDISPIKASFALATAASNKSVTVLATAKKFGLTPQFQTQIKPVLFTTLAMSAAMLAKIWNEAYILAGSPDLATGNLGQIPPSDWVPVNYMKVPKQ